VKESFEIAITKNFSLEDLKHGLYLFVFRATRIPPHLGIITDGKLYDISLQGPNTDIPVEEFYQTVSKRNSEVVFIELKKPMLSGFLDDEMKRLVNEYWKVSKEVSCLAPIKDLIGRNYNLEAVEQAHFLFELLPILESNKLIKSTVQLNLDNKLNNNVLSLKKYTKEDIENCINALQRKEQHAC